MMLTLNVGATYQHIKTGDLLELMANTHGPTPEVILRTSEQQQERSKLKKIWTQKDFEKEFELYGI